MLLLSILLVLVTTSLLYKLMTRKKRRLPPGPMWLPIIGNLLSIDPKKPHESLSEMSWKYGPVCGLAMGSVYTVLLSDPKTIRQVLAKDSFSGRAPLYLTHGIMKGYGLICAEGNLWREQRKFTTSCLKKLGMVKSPCNARDQLEVKISKFVDEAINKLESRSDPQLGEDPHNVLHHCVGNLINELVFGKTYEENDVTWKWLQHVQEEGVKHIGVAGPLNFLPFLVHLPKFRNIMKLIVDGQAKTHDIYRQIARDHQRSIEANDCLLTAYQQEVDKRKSENQDLGTFDEIQINYLLADLYGAGVDTTLTTLRWFLLFMTAYPQEQAKIHQEMDNMMKEGENIKWEDKTSLIYLEAVIAETQRIRSVVPTGIPHGAVEDGTIDSYEIPKGTMIVPLQWAIHMNPKYWNNPTIFDPSRFLTKEGALAKPEAFMPFQVGKRMCVGDELARMILFLFCGKILHQFTLSSPSSETPDLEGDCGITLVPRPHKIIFRRRLKNVS